MSKLAAAERAAITRLIDAFDAEILVNVTPPPTIERKTLAKLRYRAVELAEDCTACGLCATRLRGDGVGPAFPAQSMAGCDLIVVLPHPEPKEGRYTRMIRHALSMVDTVTVERVSFIGAVGCVPRTADGSLRAAIRDEQRACEANLYRALDAANAPSVLFVGKHAMNVWRNDLSIEQMRGVVGVWRDRWFVGVVEHPAAAMHEGKSVVQDWQRGVAKVVRMLHSGDAMEGLGARCVAKKCNEGVFAWDQDAVPWCKNHIQPAKRARPKEFLDVAMDFDMEAEG